MRPGRRATIIQISGENSSGPENVTLTLFRKFRTPLADAITYNGAIRALITWGAGKCSQQVTCDFHHGTRLTLDASSLEVTALYESTDGATVAGPDLEVSCSVVFGNIGTRNLTLTRYFELAAGATSPVIDVPSFAGRATLLTDNNTPTLIRWEDGKVNNLVTLTVGSNVETPVPNGAEQVQFANGDVVPHDYALIWGLNL